MPHSDAPDSPSFKIRDGLGVLGCLVISAVIIVLGSRAGLFSLTPVSSLFLGAERAVSYHPSRSCGLRGDVVCEFTN